MSVSVGTARSAAMPEPRFALAPFSQVTPPEAWHLAQTLAADPQAHDVVEAPDISKAIIALDVYRAHLASTEITARARAVLWHCHGDTHKAVRKKEVLF